MTGKSIISISLGYPDTHIHENHLLTTYLNSKETFYFVRVFIKKYGMYNVQKPTSECSVGVVTPSNIKYTCN